jgi:hypothetical protein
MALPGEEVKNGFIHRARAKADRGRVVALEEYIFYLETFFKRVVAECICYIMKLVAVNSCLVMVGTRE